MMRGQAPQIFFPRTATAPLPHGSAPGVRLRQHLHAVATELESSRRRYDDRALRQLKPLSLSVRML